LKRINYIVFAAFLMTFAVSGGASAQTSGNKQLVNIAVLNLEAIRRTAKAVGSIREQILKYKASFEAEIKKEDEELRNANQELARQRSILSPEAFVEKRRDFEKRVVAAQRKAQKRKLELDKVQAISMSKVEAKLNEIVTKLAKKHNLALVLRGSQTILAVQQLNITVEVLKILNAELPSIVVPKPGK